MECKRVHQLLPGYLDGALPSGGEFETHSTVGHHLAACRDCREELQRYLELSSLMSQVQRPVPPQDLALRIRVAAAQRLSENDWLHLARRIHTRATLFLENILEPLALPATGGLAVALVVFALVSQFLGGGAPLRGLTPDLPTDLLQPAQLEALAPFPVVGLGERVHAGAHALFIDATVNAQGQAVSYKILAGPDDPFVRRQLDQVLLFSRFRPQMNFGRPTPGGHVILNFSNIHVIG